MFSAPVRTGSCSSVTRSLTILQQSLYLQRSVEHRGFETPKRGVNCLGPFEVCNTGLHWSALWSFSSLLADDLRSSVFPSLFPSPFPLWQTQIETNPKIIPKMVLELPVNQRILTFKSLSFLKLLHLSFLKRTHSMGTRVHTLQIIVSVGGVKKSHFYFRVNWLVGSNVFPWKSCYSE